MPFGWEYIPMLLSKGTVDLINYDESTPFILVLHHRKLYIADSNETIPT
jgi:hypothetical protein